MSKAKPHRQKCDICGTKTDLFISILRSEYKRSTRQHWIFCLDCYNDERVDPWLADREAQRQELRTISRPPKPNPPVKKTTSRSDEWDKLMGFKED